MGNLSKAGCGCHSLDILPEVLSPWKARQGPGLNKSSKSTRGQALDNFWSLEKKGRRVNASVVSWHRGSGNWRRWQLPTCHPLHSCNSPAMHSPVPCSPYYPPSTILRFHHWPQEMWGKLWLGSYKWLKHKLLNSLATWELKQEQYLLENLKGEKGCQCSFHVRVKKCTYPESAQHKEFSQSKHNCVIRDLTQHRDVTSTPETPFQLPFSHTAHLLTP